MKLILGKSSTLSSHQSTRTNTLRIEDVLGSTATGVLPPLASMIGLPDFEWAARKFMNTTAYTYYRNGAAGEWSYRNNLEIFSRYRFRPRVLGSDVTKIEETLQTTLLGYNFSMPIFISPAARGGYANPAGEEGLVKAAGEAGILYMPSGFSSLTMETIAGMRVQNGSHGLGPQVTFQQVRLSHPWQRKYEHQLTNPRSTFPNPSTNPPSTSSAPKPPAQKPSS